MSTVKEIESALNGLSLEEKQAVRDWLDDLIEDQLEVSDEFKAKIQRAKREIADGQHSRAPNPEAAQAKGILHLLAVGHRREVYRK